MFNFVVRGLFLSAGALAVAAFVVPLVTAQQPIRQYPGAFRNRNPIFPTFPILTRTPGVYGSLSPAPLRPGGNQVPGITGMGNNNQNQGNNQGGNQGGNIGGQLGQQGGIGGIGGGIGGGGQTFTGGGGTLQPGMPQSFGGGALGVYQLQTFTTGASSFQSGSFQGIAGGGFAGFGGAQGGIQGGQFGGQIGGQFGGQFGGQGGQFGGGQFGGGQFGGGQFGGGQFGGGQFGGGKIGFGVSTGL